MTTLLMVQALLVSTLIYGPVNGFLRVCYFPAWAYNRASTFARFGASNVEADVCTHLIYAFARIDQSNHALLSPDNDEESRYKSFNELKKKNSALRTLLSIGGQNDHGEGFVAVSQTETVTNSFAKSVVIYLRKYGFDGLDIDWEYPNSDTKQNFIIILKNLRAAFNQDTRSPRLLLTVAAPAGSGYITQGFHVPEINRYVDYVSIMAYDFVDARYSEQTNFNSPLYSRNSFAFNQEFSLNWTVSYYKSLGLQPNKILVGVSGTGKWLVLNSTSMSVPGSIVVKGSLRNSSDYYITGGITFAEICKFILTKANTIRVFDDQQKATYLVNEDDWITYEDVDSIKEKTKWALNSSLAGLMFWSMDQDDFSGKGCNKGTFPLLKSVRAASETTTGGATVNTSLIYLIVCLVLTSISVNALV